MIGYTMLPTYNENQFVRVIAIKSPPAGGDVLIEGHPIFLTGVFRWECVFALYEKEFPEPEADDKFLGFLDESGEVTWSRYGATDLVLPWLFGAFGLGRILTIWRGRHHAKKRFGYYRKGGSKARAFRSTPVR
jgi:hypothetical protein